MAPRDPPSRRGDGGVTRAQPPGDRERGPYAGPPPPPEGTGPLLGINLQPHDSSLWGWTIVAAYLLAAALSLGAGLLTQRARRGPRRLSWFWFGCAAALIALAINKQLDLHGDFERLVERNAREYGWYGERRIVQAWFVRAAVAGGIVLAAVVLFMYRRGSPQHWLAIAGIGGLAAFVAIRAASFHDVDAVLGMQLGARLSVSRALELGGALLIGATALWASLEMLTETQHWSGRSRGRGELEKAVGRR